MFYNLLREKMNYFSCDPRQVSARPLYNWYMQLNEFFCRNDKSNIKKAQIYLSFFKLVEGKAVRLFFQPYQFYFGSSFQITELNCIGHISNDVKAALLSWKK